MVVDRSDVLSLHIGVKSFELTRQVFEPGAGNHPVSRFQPVALDIGILIAQQQVKADGAVDQCILKLVAGFGLIP